MQESVVAVTDSSGNVLNSYVYDPYGNLFLDSETVANPWQFAIGYRDGDIGLLKFGTRYYDPSLGRWTQHVYTESRLLICQKKSARLCHSERSEESEAGD